MRRLTILTFATLTSGLFGFSAYSLDGSSLSSRIGQVSSDLSASVIVENAVGIGAGVLAKKACLAQAAGVAAACGSYSFGILAGVCTFSTYALCESVVTEGSKGVYRALSRHATEQNLDRIRKVVFDSIDQYGYRQSALYCQNKAANGEACTTNEANDIYQESVFSVAPGFALVVDDDRIDRIIDEIVQGKTPDVDWGMTSDRVEGYVLAIHDLESGDGAAERQLHREKQAVEAISNIAEQGAQAIAVDNPTQAAIDNAQLAKERTRKYARQSLSYMSAMGEFTLALHDAGVKLPEGIDKIADASMQLGQAGLQIESLAGVVSPSPLKYFQAATIGLNVISGIFGKKNRTDRQFEYMQKAFDAVFKELQDIQGDLNEIKQNQQKLFEALVSIDNRMIEMHVETMSRFDKQDAVIKDIYDIVLSDFRKPIHHCRTVYANLSGVLPGAENKQDKDRKLKSYQGTFTNQLMSDRTTVEITNALDGETNAMLTDAIKNGVSNPLCLAGLEEAFGTSPRANASITRPFQLDDANRQILDSKFTPQQKLSYENRILVDELSMTLLRAFSDLSNFTTDQISALQSDTFNKIMGRDFKKQSVALMLSTPEHDALLRKLSVDGADMPDSHFNCKRQAGACEWPDMFAKSMNYELFISDAYFFLTTSHLLIPRQAYSKPSFICRFFGIACQEQSANYWDQSLIRLTNNAIRWADVMIARATLGAGDVLLPILYGLLKNNVPGLEEHRATAVSIVEKNPTISENLMRYWLRESYMATLKDNEHVDPRKFLKLGLLSQYNRHWPNRLYQTTNNKLIDGINRVLLKPAGTMTNESGETVKIPAVTIPSMNIAGKGDVDELVARVFNKQYVISKYLTQLLDLRQALILRLAQLLEDNSTHPNKV